MSTDHQESDRQEVNAQSAVNISLVQALIEKGITPGMAERVVDEFNQEIRTGMPSLSRFFAMHRHKLDVALAELGLSE